jgi:hypothetical protein
MPLAEQRFQLDVEKSDGEVSWRHLIEVYGMRAGMRDTSPQQPANNQWLFHYNSRIGSLWNVRWAGYSAFAPENLTTLPHFSVSSAIS